MAQVRKTVFDLGQGEIIADPAVAEAQRQQSLNLQAAAQAQRAAQFQQQIQAALAGQAESARQFDLNLRDRQTGRQFRAGEAQKGRDFTAGQNELARALQQALQQNSQTFRAGENVKERGFKADQNSIERQLRAALSSNRLDSEEARFAVRQNLNERKFQREGDLLQAQQAAAEAAARQALMDNVASFLAPHTGALQGIRASGGDLPPDLQAQLQILRKTNPEGAKAAEQIILGFTPGVREGTRPFSMDSLQGLLDPGGVDSRQDYERARFVAQVLGQELPPEPEFKFSPRGSEPYVAPVPPYVPERSPENTIPVGEAPNPYLGSQPDFGPRSGFEAPAAQRSGPEEFIRSILRSLNVGGL